MDFYDSNIWYVFSFVIFLGIVFKFAIPVITKVLDERIVQIKTDLEEAENLRVEAQEMLAQYQRKHRDAVKEAEGIIAKAKESAKEYKKQAEAELDELMKRREAQLSDRLKRMEQNALNEIQAHAAELSINAARQIVIEKLDKKTNAKLVEDSISEIEKRIHVA